MKNLIFIENRSEIGAGTRGARLGVDAIQVAADQRGSKFFGMYESKRIADKNECLGEDSEKSSANRIDKIELVLKEVHDEVSATINHENSFPLVIAGDHASAAGTISGLRTAYPEERIGVIWIDAHADLHSPYTSPSGNVHGMPLACALNLDNLESQINNLDKGTIHSWENLKAIGGVGAKFNCQDLVFVGVRDTEPAEDYLINQLNIKNHLVDEVRWRGAQQVAADIIDRLNECDKIYISLDVDALDCDLVSHGTGTPVKNGLYVQEVVDLVNEIFKTDKVCCLELVEVNPLLDEKGNKMAETALSILELTAGNYFSSKMNKVTSELV